MYSYEIDQILKSQNYIISPETYIDICNTSPQIIKKNYEPYDEYFNIWTNDNYYWKFKVKLKGEQ